MLNITKIWLYFLEDCCLVDEPNLTYQESKFMTVYSVEDMLLTSHAIQRTLLEIPWISVSLANEIAPFIACDAYGINLYLVNS